MTVAVPDSIDPVPVVWTFVLVGFVGPVFAGWNLDLDSVFVDCLSGSVGLDLVWVDWILVLVGLDFVVADYPLGSVDLGLIAVVLVDFQKSMAAGLPVDPTCFLFL